MTEGRATKIVAMTRMVAASAIIALLLALIPLRAVAATSTEAMYQEARKHYYSLLGSKRKMAYRSNWVKVIKKFDHIAEHRASTSRGRDALYTTGLLYAKLSKISGWNDDRKEAIDRFERVIYRYPKSSLVDDAQRQIGDLRFSSGDTKGARESYAKTRTRKRSRSSHNATLAGIRSFTQNGYTRIVLDMTAKTPFKDAAIKGPSRIFVDLMETDIARALPKVIRLSKGPVKTVRTARNSEKTTRVVFDLRDDRAVHQISYLPSPNRVVIDIGKGKRRAVASKPKAAQPRQAKAPSPKPAPMPVISSRPRGPVALRTIVIDAGHGGKDPGAIGPRGLKEKHVTLSIAKKLKRKLERRTGAKVILTRSNDRFLELDERTVLANAVDADLFISVHANASRNRRAKGLETYFLSPARSKDELETAARENMIAKRTGNEMENDLAYIMADLSNTQKVNDSYELAGSVQRSMVRGMRRSHRGIKDKGVKQAMFYVLWRASMPSILVEAGFISNPTTEQRFRSSRYLDDIADSIADGVVAYGKSMVVATR